MNQISLQLYSTNSMLQSIYTLYLITGATSTMTFTSSTSTIHSVSFTSSTITPTPSSMTGFSIISVAGGAAGGFIAITVIILVVVLLIVCLLCKKQQRTNAIVKKPEQHPMEQLQVTAVERYCEQPILSYSDKPLTGTNPVRGEYSYIDYSTDQIMNSSEAKNMYQEIPEPPSHPPPSTIPISATKPYHLIENPQYESVTSHMSSEGLGSDFNIYATPNIPPAIPVYKGSLWDINLDPSHFTSQESISQSSSMTDRGTPEQLLPLPSTYPNPTPLEKADILEVTEENVKIISELGVGQFGKVYLAHTVDLTLRDLSLGSTGQTVISALVAVKFLHSDANELDKETFEKEVKFMSRLQNENIVQILGVCLRGNAFIMMEYMENGDLNQYLQKFEYSHEEPSEDNGSFITSSSLVYIVLQIASGMHYLAGKNYVHRDLATRNCLISQKFLVKIADFGMSRELYDNNYYRLRGRAMLPIRWMAKECFYGQFSEKTDVWAYGVVMWEIFTLCHCQPYEDFNNQEVIDNAIVGAELEEGIVTATILS